MMKHSRYCRTLSILAEPVTCLEAHDYDLIRKTSVEVTCRASNNDARGTAVNILVIERESGIRVRDYSAPHIIRTPFSLIYTNGGTEA